MRLRRFRLFGNLLVAALLMLATWVLLVWVASRPAFKRLIDLTPQRINSVDPVTEDLLRELRAAKVEVEFHLFYPSVDGSAQDLAGQQVLAIRQRLRDLTDLLLRRYQFLGGELLTINYYDFYGDAAATRKAVADFAYTAQDGDAVVVAMRQPGKERRFRKLSLVSDLAIIEQPETPGSPVRRMPVPVLKDYKGEEAISSALKSLLVQGIPVVYFLKGYSTSLDFAGTDSFSYSGFRAALQKLGFDVRELRLSQTQPVPADAAAVLVIEPTSNFVERDAVALFEYVKRGGRVFINYAWSHIPESNPDGGKFGELLGYEIGERPVFHLIPDVSGRAGGRGMDGNNGVAKLQLLANRSHPTTRRLAESQRPFEVAYARELRERGASREIVREDLLMTGEQGWTALPEPNGEPSYRAPAVGLRAFVVGSAFQVNPAASGDNTAVPGSARPGQVIVVAGAFCNNAGMPFFGAFALNICSWLTERRVLLDIQGSRYQANHLDLKPQQFARVWYLLVCGVPGAFLLLGVVVYRRRRN
ncbi:MAG TPA: Gldg family protein [Planctomycetota bacterium]|nr:Gldg family protein [Planctomycetota bacterium]